MIENGAFSLWIESNYEEVNGNGVLVGFDVVSIDAADFYL